MREVTAKREARGAAADFQLLQQQGAQTLWTAARELALERALAELALRDPAVSEDSVKLQSFQVGNGGSGVTWLILI